MQSRPDWVRQPPDARDASDQPEVLAAVDLGSNSFHMVVARLTHGQLTVIDRLREMVRLAAGLDEQNRLDRASRERALACLSRFGERIRDMHADTVRVVGTNTLRKARRAGEFLEEAEALLGHPVEIISGIEEARLIYLGASHSLPFSEEPQLVIDIGGGSTEVIRGRGYRPEALESLYVGCVSLSAEHFGNGKLSARRLERARLAARLEFEPIRARLRQGPALARSIGASGTIRAAGNVLAALGGDGSINAAGVEMLIAQLVAAGRVDRLALPGLSEQRKPVFAGGLAILVEALAALDIERLTVADGALREGILYDLVGRLTDEDERVRTVRAMEARFHVDTAQAERVAHDARRLLEGVAAGWGLEDPEHAAALEWAARLHEIGLDIAHAHYHRHGAYLLEHADMPGFPTDEQGVLARLVGAHRRHFSRKTFGGMPRDQARTEMRLAVLLRLAVLFNRSRTGALPTPVRCRTDGKRLVLEAPGSWFDANPLTLADLEREQAYLAEAGFDMVLERAPDGDGGLG